MKQGGVLDAENAIQYNDWHKANSSINVAWRNTADGTGIELVWRNELNWTWPVSSINQVGSSDTDTQDDIRPIILSWDDINEYTHALKHYQIRQENEIENIASDAALRHRGYK